MIVPSIGRVVWFWPETTSSGAWVDQPLAAIVTYVWNERMVNLAVFDRNGVAHSRTSVTLLQDDDAPNEGGHYCEWMPFQKGQAAKAEALEAELKSTAN